MNIFITGIAGALGSSLANMLHAEGYSVCGNDIIALDESDLDFHYIWKATEDLKLSDLKGTDIIINCCATADRPMGISSPEHTLHNNTIPLIRILELSRKLNIDKFIHAGSGTPYIGISDDKLPAIETTIPEPKNIYSASKYCQDIICMTYNHAYNIPIIIMRAGMVYGTGRLAIAPHRFINQALRNEPITIYGGKQTRTPTYITDVLEYWKKIIELPSEQVTRRIFHTVYPTTIKELGEYSILEIAEKIIKITKSDSVIQVSGYEPGETVNTRPCRESIISTTAKELDVKPKINIDLGLKKTVTWLESLK